jgi:hypothetical protein
VQGSSSSKAAAEQGNRHHITSSINIPSTCITLANGGRHQ